MSIPFSTILPSKLLEYRTTFNDNLLSVGNSLFDYLDDRKLIKVSHSLLDGTPVRRVYDYNHERLHPKADNTIIQKLGKELEFDKNSVQIRFSEILPVRGLESYSDSYTRIENIVPDKQCKLQLNKPWGTSHWHCDFGDHLNAMNIIVYLNDVEEQCGGTSFALPLQQLELDNIKKIPIFKEGSVKSSEVPYVEIIGKAGTVLTFNGHLVHRATPSSVKSRKSLHMVIYSDNPKHLATPYLLK